MLGDCQHGDGVMTLLLRGQRGTDQCYVKAMMPGVADGANGDDRY